MEFQKQSIIDFLNIALQTKPGMVCGNQTKEVNKLPQYYEGLTVKASVGMGVATEIPWISFTGYNQKTSNGIYPVILFYHEKKTLIVAFGISATNKPVESWPLKGVKTLDQYFIEQNIPQTKLEKKYNASFVHSVFPVHVANNKVNESVFNVDNVIDSLSKVCNIYKNHFEGKNTADIKEKPSCKEVSLYTQEKIEEKQTFKIANIINYINETGLLYSPSLIKRFAFSLMAKRFLILSGLAGSGKTQLALAFAKALVEDKEKQMCMVSVGADWTNREPLLGYPNALKAGEYIKPENGVLDLLIEANKPCNATKPFFLILDEMNMSYVERYFADFLSAMESHEPIALWKDCNNECESCECDVPERIGLPNNLFIIGTINVDETTYMFSPKVLDRANVIEFKISIDEMTEFLDGIRQVDCSSICSKAAEMGADFVKLANYKDFDNVEVTTDTLKAFFTELKSVNAEFGYRSATEIFRFISQAHKNDDTAEKMSKEEILDAAILQKLLPKLHGSRKKLEPALKGLWKLCFDPSIKDTMQIARENIDKAIYKESADKIFRMYESAYANGFTSFAEA